MAEFTSTCPKWMAPLFTLFQFTNNATFVEA